MEELHPDVEALLREYGFAGVIFNLQNAKDNEKATRLVDAMQAANASVPGRPQLLTFTDQEGGYVTRLGQGTQMPGNMALGAVSDPAVTESAGFLIGEEVTAIGYSGAFAPVLDVNSNPANPVIGIRSFSDDPQTVAEQGVAFMNGLHKAGALSALKHFPGHGDTNTDSHTGLPYVNKTYEELKAFELIPFQAAIDAGADMVMTAHIVYPQVEMGTYVSRKTGEEIGLPATLSKAILTDILRDDMGFEGLIVTDAMNMDAIAEHFDFLDAVRLAIEAGVDIILMPVDTSSPEGLEALRQYISDAAAMAEEGILSMEAVNAAVLRVLAFKEKHGMLTPYACEDIETKVQQAVSTVGSQAHHEIEFEIAKKSITLVKNEGVFPLNLEESVAVLVPFSSETLSAEYAVQRLKDEGTLPEDAPISVLYIGNMMVNDLVNTAQKTKHLIVVHAAYSLNGMNPAKTNGSDSVIVETLLTLAHAAGNDVTVISAQLPYDAARFPKADAIILAYGARGMSEDPRHKEYSVSQYGPNLPAAIYLALSGQTMTGKLPVNVPVMNENCEFTDEILYARGYSTAATEETAGQTVKNPDPVLITDCVCGEEPSFTAWNQSGETIAQTCFRLRYYDADNQILLAPAEDGMTPEMMMDKNWPELSFEGEWEIGEVMFNCEEDPFFVQADHVEVALSSCVLADGSAYYVPESNLLWFSSATGEYLNPNRPENSYQYPDAETEKKASAFQFGMTYIGVYPEYAAFYQLPCAGLYVLSFEEDSILQKAGMEVGDIILSADNMQWDEEPMMMFRAKANIVDGSEVIFTLLRGEERMTISVGPEDVGELK